jgi:hypothetical protein
VGQRSNFRRRRRRSAGRRRVRPRPGTNSGVRRPGLIALAILLLVQALASLALWLDSTPDFTFQTLWISAATVFVSIVLWVRAKSTFALLVAGIAAVIAWSALWDEILSPGESPHTPPSFASSSWSRRWC